VGCYIEIIVDKSVVCREEVCVASDRLHLKGNIVILQQRLLISPSRFMGGETVSILQAHIASTSRARKMRTEGVEEEDAALLALMEA